MANLKIIGAIVALIFAILFFIAGVVVLPVLYETLETSDSDDYQASGSHWHYRSFSNLNCSLDFLVIFIYTSYNYLQYGIAVDAGSSHTTMYFCRWPIPKYKGTGEVEEIHDCDAGK